MAISDVLQSSVLKRFAIFSGKHLRWSLFFNEDAGLQTCNFIKKRLQCRCFPVNIAKFLRTAVFIEHLRRLLFSLRMKNNFILKFQISELQNDHKM